MTSKEGAFDRIRTRAIDGRRARAAERRRAPGTGDPDVDVLIAGAGPSGLAAAIGLARHQVRVLVVDRRDGPSRLPKATGLRTRGLEILRSWGLQDRLREVEVPVHPRAAIGSTLVGSTLEYRNWLPDESVMTASSPTTFSSVAQDQLEPVLLEHARACGVDVRFGTELEDFVDEGHRVRARLREARSGADVEISASFLVGADGVHSSVRHRLGITLTSYGSKGDQVAMLFYAEIASRLPDGLSLGHVVTEPGATGMMFPSPSGSAPAGAVVATPRLDRWVYTVAAADVSGPHPSTWTDQRWVERIRRAAGLPDLAVRLHRSFGWDFGAAAATAMSAGRVFLVGDAAHRTSPSGGTGISVGIADSHNLAWKIAWVLRGWADPELLDSYDAERAPVAHRAARRSMSDEEDDPYRRLADDIAQPYQSVMISSGDASGPAPDLASLDGRPGLRTPHLWISRDGRRLSTLDLFEGRLTLLTGPRGFGWSATISELRRSGVPVRRVTVGHDVHDDDSSLLERFGLEDTGAVLVRPDGYVAWRAVRVDPMAEARLQQAVATALGRRARSLTEDLAVAC